MAVLVVFKYLIRFKEKIGPYIINKKIRRFYIIKNIIGQGMSSKVKIYFGYIQVIQGENIKTKEKAALKVFNNKYFNKIPNGNVKLKVFNKLLKVTIYK